MPRSGRFWGHVRRWWWAWWLGLTFLSHVPEFFPPRAARDERVRTLEIPRMTRDGAGAGSMTLAYRTWASAGGRVEGDLPIILLHGSPGSSGNFAALGPALASLGHRSIAPDLPGFGDSEAWVPDYSIRAHARAVLAMMDALGIERAHLVVWSMGGGVALHMADIAPARVASLTLIAAIASQEGEGSGDYFFEHAKYLLGYGVLVLAGEVVPIPWHHERAARHAFMRNFLDTDQRPLSGIMARLAVPTLILHGDNDPLVPAFAARMHHETIQPSRLVMLDGSHFLPVARAEESAAWIDAFLRDVARGTFARSEVNRAFEPARGPVLGAIFDLFRALRDAHWALQTMLFVLLARLGQSPAIAIAGLLRAADAVTIAVALTGLLIDRALRRERHPLRLLGSGVAMLALAFFAWLLAEIVVLPLTDRLGLVGLALGVLVLGWSARIARDIWTREGRRGVMASIGRWANHEFWPMRVFYLPLAPWLIWLAIRHRGALLFTRVNPGIAGGGGIAGESKLEILDAFRDRDSILEAHLVPAGEPAERRADRVRSIMASSVDLREFPVVLKPLAGERGFALRIARRDGDLLDYFQSMTRDAICQRYHPGPIEVGVLWARDPDDPSRGRVVSITRKEFPAVVGDGKRSIRDLILSHPRFRCQAGMFLARLRDQSHDRSQDVPLRGERVSLGGIGNHAQGAIFHDGHDLRTLALEERIDAIARSFVGVGGGELDYGRFDVRCTSFEALERGEDLGVVELNGAMAESTNLYDPGRSAIFAYRVLMGQWSLLYRLGAMRRRRGSPGVSARELVRMIRGHHSNRPGDAVAR